MKYFDFKHFVLFACLVAAVIFGDHVAHHGVASFGSFSDLSMLGLAVGLIAPQNSPQVIVAERSRRLQTQAFIPNSIQAVPINCDSVYKSLSMTLSGSLQVTFTGTFTATPMASFDALVPRIEVLVDGRRTVKNVRPWLVTTKSFFSGGNLNERKSSAGASPLVPANPTVDGGWAVGTSTQYTTVRETITLYFQDVLARPASQELTFLNLAQASTAQLIFTFAAFNSVEAANNAATGISYANNTLSISTSTREQQDLINKKYADLKETTQSASFTGQVNEQPIQINVGNFVRGIWIMVNDGDAAKSLSNTALGAIALKQNGFTPIKEYQSFLKIQAENRDNFGINAPLVAGASRIDGVAYMDLLRDRDPTSALDARNLQTLQLFVSTAASGQGATYSPNAVNVTVQIDEYVMPA